MFSGSISVASQRQNMAALGKYFVCTNPTPGTALAYNVQAAYSDTVPLMYIQNNDSKANPLAKRMYLDYIKLICTVAPASSTGTRGSSASCGTRGTGRSGTARAGSSCGSRGPSGAGVTCGACDATSTGRSVGRTGGACSAARVSE